MLSNIFYTNVQNFQLYEETMLKKHWKHGQDYAILRSTKKIAASLFAIVIFFRKYFCYKQHEKSYDNTYFAVAKLSV